MKTTLTIAAATAALAAGGIAATGAGATAPSPTSAATASTAVTRHVEGRVTAINRSARTFTVRDAERGTLKVKVTSSTKFERVDLHVAAHRQPCRRPRQARRRRLERHQGRARRRGVDEPRRR